MDRLISLEPSNVVLIRIENGQKCCGELVLRNVMYTMPVAFRLQPVNKARYSIRPQSGIISPLTTVTIEITYDFHQNSSLPKSLPYCDDSFFLHSVVVPGAAVKNPSSTHDLVPSDWFTARKKQVFVDSGIRVMFVGSLVMASLVKNGCMDEIRDVLEKGDPSWRAVDSVDGEGQTLLHLAIAQNRADLVQLLLEFGPDIEARNRFGSTPLEAAACSGEGLIVELLLAHRASTDRLESSIWGPIHLAAGGGHVDVLRLLLLKGANVNMLTKDGNTGLHLAVEERRKDCARLLLASGARHDIRNSGEGDTPLHIAAALGDDYMVKLLLQKGAYKDIRNHSGKRAYDLAAEQGHTKLFDALGLGDRLCIAARKGEVRTINKILESGAVINGQDQHGWTVLHRAAFKGRDDVVRFLIKKGVDINARDEDGYTALHCAVESGHVDLLELLVKKGADVEVRTNKGATAMQIAESLNYSGIKRVLIQAGANKDEFTHISKIAPAFANKSDKEIGSTKKRGSRTKALRGSFDQSAAPLAAI
ncbi:ankyrin repeat and protein kinase domain-containing protein 1-like [Cynara cardunculus var. scolymus]|uniref:Ankyrin repeat-containing protein n=1 Tax=Cynara cardunculus var. scolymus TaxID=59895 RepID=A0A103YI11_CYNCS|nr:ankyrin repeat and protein kinase domain-containing protein 1-like [Cynara cardunculus var. scolymus]KVI09494.1 Ankyrin repeat-containing protein [Cynara cardunculus var. scolymus]